MKLMRWPCGPPYAVTLNLITVLMNSEFDKMRSYIVGRSLLGMILVCMVNACSINKGQKLLYIYNDRGEVKYDNLKNWAAHPLKRDNSDSLSNAYQKDVNEDLCDIFFLHPTSLTDKKKRSIVNADIDDQEINQKTDETSILYQASIFNGIGRIYAPRYRQAHIQRYFDTGNIQSKAFEIAYADVRASFLEYLERWNNDRPIVIAAHSQGTTHAIRLISEMIDGHELASNIAYYYLLGMPVPKAQFKTIMICENDTSSNCFFSWRTYRKGFQDKYTSKSRKDIAVSNPVDIKIRQGWTGKDKKEVAILWNYNVGYKKTHDTKVMGDMLWITRPKFIGGILGLFMTNYHAGDFNLFYGDIRKDIKRRMLNYQLQK